MSSIVIFILLDLFISENRGKFDKEVLKDFRSVIIDYIIRSSSYVSFMQRLIVKSTFMDKNYCSLLYSFKRYVRKAQKVCEGNL